MTAADACMSASNPIVDMTSTLASGPGSQVAVAAVQTAIDQERKLDDSLTSSQMKAAVGNILKDLATLRADESDNNYLAAGCRPRSGRHG